MSSGGHGRASAIRPRDLTIDGVERKRGPPEADEGKETGAERAAGGEGRDKRQRVEVRGEDLPDEGDASAEARTPKVTRFPGDPTKEQRRQHECTRCPYRSWCRFCVEGRAREMAHKLVDQSTRKISTVSFDYLFVTRGGVHTREEFEVLKAGETALKVLVVCDSKSKATFAHGVPAKGLDDKGFIVRCIADDVAWLGYSRVVLKSDNEPAIVAFLKPY